ncbi:hypothetical protein Sjap_012240 [Stephania japonica]|uniref:Uncharacterized protein n=1 Tax=Stephania japonica TaxID=461633 RepID=A0AAP0IVP1_9MAGN
MKTNPFVVCTLLALINLSISSIYSFKHLEKTPTAENTTVHDVLADYGLPPGLLPDPVKSYSLTDDGSFVVDLENTCYVQFEYLVYYDRRITGVLKYGSITELKGIQVKKFFLWLNVDEIRVDLPPSDSIYFQVGFINKKLDVKQFEALRSCGDNAAAAAARRQPLAAERRAGVISFRINCADIAISLSSFLSLYTITTLLIVHQAIAITKVHDLLAQLFLWLKAEEIKYESDREWIDFQVGFISKRFSDHLTSVTSSVVPVMLTTCGGGECDGSVVA